MILNFIINKENLINNSQKIYELLSSHVSESFRKANRRE